MLFIVTQHVKSQNAQEKYLNRRKDDFEINFIMIYIKYRFWRRNEECVQGDCREKKRAENSR